MSERTVVSETPAIAPYKVPGLEMGASVDHIRFVTYTDNTTGFRCHVCQKEFPTFGACSAHYTHHFRTKESYIHDGTRAGRKAKNPKSVANTVESILRNAIGDISLDVAEAISGESSGEIARLNERISFLAEQLADEKKRRQQAEKDLAKIRNLVK
jgi:hypothetical protein